MSISWNDLFTQGTLIDFSVHLWRARIRLTAEDLGIDDTEDVKKAFSFGCHRLAPAKAFESINSCVNSWTTAIEEHSFAFPLLRGVRYVPDGQVRELQRKLDLYLREFNICVGEFIEDYDRMMHEMLPTLEQALHDAAKSTEAANSAYSRVIQEYPSAAKVALKFGLEWNFFSISLPSSKDAAVTAKSAIPQVQKVVASMIEQLRTELSDKVANLISLAQKTQSGSARHKNGFGKASKESAFSVLEKVDRLNVLGDSVLKEQTEMLRSMLTADNADINTTVRALDRIKSNLESDIEEAAEVAEKRLTGLGNRKIAI